MALTLINNLDSGLSVRTTLNQVIDLTGSSHPYSSGSIVFVDSSGDFAQDNTNFVWDNTAKALQIGSGSPSITASAPLFDGSQTWNAGGVTFTGIKINITNTASAAASLLQDWQVGGASKLSIAVDGNLKIGTVATIGPFNRTQGDVVYAVPQAIYFNGTDAAFNESQAMFQYDNMGRCLSILYSDGTQFWQIHNAGSPAGVVSYTCPLGYPGVAIQTTDFSKRIGWLYDQTTDTHLFYTKTASLAEIKSTLRPDGYTLQSDCFYGWTSSATDAHSAPDTAIARNAAGVVEINNGAAGTFRDLKVRNVTHSAGTSTVAPINLVSGTNLTTAVAGTIEYDGKVFYATPDASNRGVCVSKYIIRQDSTYTLANSAAVQKLFNASANGAITLPTGTYYFECMVYITGMSNTSGNAAFSIANGTGVCGSFLYNWAAAEAAGGASGSWQSGMSITAATPAAMATAGAGTTLPFTVFGTFEVTTGGTIIPSIQLANASAAVVAIGSYFICYPMGTTTLAFVGNWS